MSFTEDVFILFYIQDIRETEAAREAQRVWELALGDPHLVRLQDWLAHTDGEEHYSREELERSFLEEPWMCDLDIIYVVDPNYCTIPFVQIWNNKEKPHATCDFAQLATSRKKVCISYIFCVICGFCPFLDRSHYFGLFSTF